MRVTAADRRTPRPTYTVRLRPLPDVVDPTRALRTALKALLRYHRLRTIEVREECNPDRRVK